MKEKMKSAMEDIKASHGKIKEVSFAHAGLKGRSFKAKISLLDSGLFGIKISNIKGYSSTYLNRTVNKNFALAVLPDINSGDLVWTLFGDDNLQAESGHTIPGSESYFGVGNTIQNCSGRQFFNDTRAFFVRRTLGLCAPGMGKQFNIFRIA